MTENTCGIDTRLQHPRTEAASGGEPVSPPVYQSSTYVLPTPELGAEIAASRHPQRFYTRYGSPNVALVEGIVAELEGAESAVAVDSGMAAIAAAILSNVRAGDHVVAQTAHYTAALTLLTEWLPRQGVEVSQVDQTDIEAFRRAIGPRTRLVYTGDSDQPDHSANGPRSCFGAGSRAGRDCRHGQYICFELQPASANPRRRSRGALRYEIPQRP